MYLSQRKAHPFIQRMILPLQDYDTSSLGLDSMLSYQSQRGAGEIRGSVLFSSPVVTKHISSAMCLNARGLRNKILNLVFITEFLTIIHNVTLTLNQNLILEYSYHLRLINLPKVLKSKRKSKNSWPSKIIFKIFINSYKTIVFKLLIIMANLW